MIIRVLHDLVYCILHIVYHVSVVASNIMISRYSFCNERLSHAQVFYHKAEGGIHRVVLGKLLVQRASAIPQVSYLKFFRGDVLPQISDLFVEHKLELFKLLGLLLQVQYLLFSLVDDLILGVNFSLFLLLLKAELLNVLLLLVKLRPLVTDLALESFKLFFNVGELVLC